MRDFALLTATIIALGATFFSPFAGVILWTWFSIQNPHEEAYSSVHGLPLNLIIAVVTILAWLMSHERKVPPSHFLIVTMLLFLLWSTFNGFFAYSPEWSWPYWDRVWKIFALGLLIAVLANNKVRVHAIVCTIVLSLFYYGVKGGLFTLVSGGHFHVLGPERSIIADNNQLALALLMALPLGNYVRRQSSNKWVAGLALGGMVLSVVAVFGSYSRGALVALAALAFASLLRSRRRLAYAFLGALFTLAILYFMPQSFWDRANTIQHAQQDASFEGRVMAWHVAYRYAIDHFPFGAGFYGPQLPGIFNSYFPKEPTHAAHSIYFQVLGENGFPGLGLYLLIISGAFLQCSTIIRKARRFPELEWCGEFAKMIQLTLVAFCVGGAALSMAYYDVFIVCVGLLVPVGRLVATFPARKAAHGPLIHPTQEMDLNAPTCGALESLPQKWRSP